MPFTPFHLGAEILTGLLLRDHIDFPTFVAANLVVDVRATLIFFGLMEGTLHGFLHTFLFGSLLGLGLAAIAYHLKQVTGQIMEFFKLEQLDNWKSFAGVSALTIVIILLSLSTIGMYSDIAPYSDSDEDLEQKDVNLTHFSYSPPNNFRLDESDTRQNIYKYEYEGRGIVIRIDNVSMSRDQYYNSSDWSSFEAQKRRQGFNMSQGMEKRKLGSRVYWYSKWYKPVSNTIVKLDILSTFHKGKQYMFVYSATNSTYSQSFPRFVDSLNNTVYR